MHKGDRYNMTGEKELFIPSPREKGDGRADRTKEEYTDAPTAQMVRDIVVISETCQTQTIEPIGISGRSLTTRTPRD